MALFVAHYLSPQASIHRAKGQFEFESSARLGSKKLLQEARMHMLERFGSEAVSWNIDTVEHKKSRTAQSDGQLQLDFRDPAPERKRPVKKQYW